MILVEQYIAIYSIRKIDKELRSGYTSLRGWLNERIQYVDEGARAEAWGYGSAVAVFIVCFCL